MKATRITDAEIEAIAIASLPTRPTAPTAFGGRGYTATEMKAAFDKLPRLIAERLNSLIDDITDGSIAGTMPTDIDGIETLADLYSSINDGSIASKIKIGGVSLPAMITKLQSDIDTLAGRVGIVLTEGAE